MCGRYVSPAEADIEREWHIGGRRNPNPFAGSYNASPTQMLPVVRYVESGALEVSTMRWGLIPGWAANASIGAKLINARAETVAQKPAFRAAYRQRRCVVPAAGYYEWQRTLGGKQPHYITCADDSLMAFAALWERWRSPGGDIESYTIVTTAAEGWMRALHDRMPVILTGTERDEWLTAADPSDLLRGCPLEMIVARPVSSRVNSPRNDDSSLIEPAGDPLTHG